MGLLKKIFTYLYFIIFIGGCAPSIIKLETYKDDDPYSQYGKSSQREFYYDQSVSLNFTEKWESQINGGFSNSSVTVYDSAVFVNDLSGRIYCFSLASGKTLGQLKYKGSIFTAPIIHNSLIIFALVNNNDNTSNLIYYDFKLGKEIASVEIIGRITVEMLKVNEGIILISETGHIYKYDFSAKLIWDFDTKSFVHSSPASDNKYVVFGNEDGELIWIDARNGNLVDRKKIGNSFFCGAVISGNKIFIGNDDGNLYSIDLESRSINWSFQTHAKIKMEAAVTDAEIYLGNLRGELYKISKDGKLIWKLSTNGLLNMTPILAKDYLILPDADKKVYFASRTNGEVVDSILFDGRVKLSPVIRNNILFIGYENGNLRAYEITQ